MSNLRIAIIGLGVMGKNHFRINQHLDNGLLVGVHDIAFTASEFEGIPVFSSFEALIEKAKPNAAVICVPTVYHREIAKKCIDAGIDILIEKPAASTVSDAEWIEYAGSKKGVKVAVGHVERFNPVVQALKRELMGQQIHSIAITRVGPFPPRISDVGVCVDLGVHDIDLIAYLSQKEIISTSLFSERHIHDLFEDTAHFSFKLEGKCLASIHTNWITPFKKRLIEVATKDAFYEANLMSQELMEYSSYKKNNSFLTRSCYVQKGEPLLNEIKAWHTYLQTGEAGDLAKVADSIRTLKVIESGMIDVRAYSMKNTA